MKKLLFCLGVALFLTVACGPGRMVSQANADTAACTYLSYEDLLDVNKNKIAALHVVPDGVFQKYLKNANVIRLASKLYALEAKGMSVAEFKNGNVGTVLVDSKDCVVPGSLQAGKLEDMKERFVITDSVAIFNGIGEGV